ncbi:MAG: protease modulator HflC [Acidobacteriota bacterium]
MRFRFVQIVLLILVLLWLSTAVFTVPESEMGLVTRFGAPRAAAAGPGLHFKAPWPIDSVLRLDARLLVFDGEPIELLTADKKNVLVDSYLCWRIADPVRFAQTVKNRAEAEARLLDVSAAELGAAVGAVPMEGFINTDEEALELRAMSRRVAEAVDSLTRTNFGIEIVDLQVNGFTLPPQNRASVIARMRAERARIATRYRSEGEEKALEIEAAALAERERILAEARSEAEAARGEGEAEALAIFADAYRADPSFYRFLRTLEAYESIVDEETTVFLESDSPLMRTLDGP